MIVKNVDMRNVISGLYRQEVVMNLRLNFIGALSVILHLGNTENIYIVVNKIIIYGIRRRSDPWS